MDAGLAMTLRYHPDYPEPLQQIYGDFIDAAVVRWDQQVSFAVKDSSASGI
jgi:hypothetical protein